MQWEEKGGVQCQAVLPAVCACREMSESAAAAEAILYGAVLYRVRPGSVTCLSRVCHSPINPLGRMYSLYAAYKSPHLRIGTPCASLYAVYSVYIPYTALYTA